MEDPVCRHMLEILHENEYVQFLGIEIEKLVKGHCRGKMKVTKRIENPYNALHGGSLYSLADIVAGTAACTYGHYVVTVSGSMNFLLPAAGMEYVYCEADMVRQGKHLAVYDVKIMDENGNILENASFTFYITERKVLS
ncbi:MAG: PaaI family thioesterase [Ruminococcus sp.]|nr:PaaI family thioesterase [Ruminococcus sp.]